MHDKPCPRCGYCPACGRANATPYWPWGRYPVTTPIYPGTVPMYPIPQYVNNDVSPHLYTTTLAA